ncbi:hypothetical protein [Sulfitobacter sp. DSM 110093]|uniref:hypothetical protein n=1 Tax=Sulfitobacter sp. DSM 110093 TaxID=2883127 RepID=UPI001FACAF09|nr:hypothetical protein [Sulfitobacter sp. DSM 110093]
MLRDAQMAGLVKLHCSKGVIGERQEWAVICNQQKARWAVRINERSPNQQFFLPHLTH